MRHSARLGLLVALLAASPALAQDALTIGEVVTDSLAPDGRVSYTVELPSGHVVYGSATQVSVDVVLTVLGPDGSEVAEVDQTFGGAEPFQFVTEADGVYRIEVAPYEGAGRFALVVDGIEPVATTPFGRVDQMMIPFARPDTPGAVVAVVRGGEVTYAKAYGAAVLTHRLPNTPETVFNIGSVSKQFAGIAFALLAERGVLSLDDEARRYLPELPDFGTPVTLRHLLNHTSGLRETYGTAALSGRNPDEDRLTRQGVLDIAARQPTLQFEPGSEVLYNSSAYVLLTTIVERVTGETYPDWMDANVFGPLGMTHTTIEREVGQVIPNAATSYLPADVGGWAEAFDNRLYYGATDVYTTVGDLARWVHSFRTATLGVGVVARMLEKSVLASGEPSPYTLGINVAERLGHPAYFHSGATGGYRANLVYYPDEDAGVVVLANTPGVDYQGIADVLAESFLDLPEPEPADDEPEAADLGVPVDPAVLAAYAGTFAVEGAGVALEVQSRGDALAVRIDGDAPVTLRATTDSTFVIPGLEAVLTFHRAPDGTVESGTAVYGGTFAMRRVEPWAPDADDLAAYAGRYVSDEVEETYRLVVEDGALVVTHRWLGQLSLRPEDRDHFGGDWPLTSVVFERGAEDQVIGFAVSNGRTRGVRFDRRD